MKKVFRNCAYFVRYIFSNNRFFLFVSFLIAVLSSVSSILNVFLGKIAVDTVTGVISTQVFLKAILFIASIILLVSISNTAYSIWMYPVFTKKIQIDMYARLFKKTKEIEIGKFDDSAFFNMHIRALNSSSSRAIALMDTIVSIVGIVFTVIGLGSIIISINPTLILFVLVNVILSSILNTISSKCSYNQNVEQIQSEKEISYIQRVFYLKEYIKETKITKIADNLLAYLNKAGEKNIQVIKKYAPMKSTIGLLQILLNIFCNVGVLIYLAFEFSSSSILAGSFITLFNASNQLSSALKQVFSIWPKLYEHSLYIDDYRNFMEYKPKTVFNGINKELDVVSDICVKNVSFHYLNNEKEAVNNVCLEIGQQAKIAIVGPNGAGKSTLIKLLLGLERPDGGEVIYNKEIINNYSVESFRKTVGVLFQDFRMYSITIIENILMRPVDNQEDDERKVYDALKKVGMLEKVMSLPNKVYTPINRELSDTGVVFSGGELQRIALARMLVQDYKVLILDEPSSALDPIIEAQFFELALHELKDKILIIVSHRLSNLPKLDKIYYMENGSILENGTHDELMQLNGKYAKMYNPYGFKEKPDIGVD